jgi:acyl-CoA thioesterase I
MSTWGRWLAGSAVAALATLAVACAAGGMARADTEDCATPPEMTEADVKLPHLAERLAAHKPATIVAIGGSSTIGRAAGSPDLAYPHRLEQDLVQDFPADKIAVINKGVAKQSAKDMFDRFPSDVFALDPVLVVWEVGIIDAVRGTDVEEFAGTLQDGVDALKNKAIDTILVDMQFSPNSATVIDFEAYLKALRHVGDLADVYVFPRYEMMRYWSEQNVFNFDNVAEADRAKLAARVYDCLGRKLAETVHRAVP